MITGLREVVLLDRDDAAFLLEALKHIASRGLSTSGRLADIEAKLVKACANASVSGHDTLRGARKLGAQPDSDHTAPYDLVDTAEAAKILGCTPSNVRDLARRGRLPRHRAGRQWVYPARSVEVLAERRAAKRG